MSVTGNRPEGAEYFGKSPAARLAEGRAATEGHSYKVGTRTLVVVQAMPGEGGLVMDRPEGDDTDLRKHYTPGDRLVAHGALLLVHAADPARVRFTVLRKATRTEKRRHG